MENWLFTIIQRKTIEKEVNKQIAKLKNNKLHTELQHRAIME